MDQFYKIKMNLCLKISFFFFLLGINLGLITDTATWTRYLGINLIPTFLFYHTIQYNNQYHDSKNG